MEEFQNTIDLLGDKIVAASIIDRTITGEFADNRLTKIGEYAFYNCKNLTSVNLPLATQLDNSAFQQCVNLTSVNFPLVQSVESRGLQSCGNLTIIDFPSLNMLYETSLYYCSKLTVLILRSETLCKLSNTNAFEMTPFASGGTGGTVYVPAALITEYQNATNWSTLYAGGTCNFVAIEGSEYE